MPQRDLLLPWLSALDNAGLALRARGVSRAQARARRRRRGSSASGSAGFERTRPAELSGGMRQRVSFLRTLLAGKPVLALDEPFASLDAITRAEMQGWLAHVLEQRAAHGRARHPRRRGGGRARPTAWSSCRPGPGASVAEIEVELAASAAPDRPGGRARCASARSRRWGSTHETSCARPAGAAAAAWLCSASGSCTSTSAASTADPPAPHARSPRRSANDRVAAVEQLPGHRRGGAARDRWSPRSPGLVLAVAIHFSTTLRARRLPAAGRLAGDSDPDARPAARAVARVRDPARSSIVIALVSFFSIVVTTLDGLAAVDPRAAQADADVRRLPAAHVPPRRAARRAAGRLHRGQDRRRGGGDRRRVRRAWPAARTPGSGICSCSRSPSC